MTVPQSIPAKHILTRNKSTDWFGTDHTMNLYRGCPTAVSTATVAASATGTTILTG